MLGKKILIVEDEPAIAIDIAYNLESFGYDIVDAVFSGEEALEILDSKKVDLVMLDINIQGTLSGIDLAIRINNKYQIPFIYLSSQADSETVAKAAATFPASYLVKPFKEYDIAPAIQVALLKKNTYHQVIPSLENINKRQISKITKGEYLVIEPLWMGYTNKEISEQLSISPNTVKTHIKNIYSKLHVGSKPELIRYLREMQ